MEAEIRLKASGGTCPEEIKIPSTPGVQLKPEWFEAQDFFPLVHGECTYGTVNGFNKAMNVMNMIGYGAHLKLETLGFMELAVN